MVVPVGGGTRRPVLQLLLVAVFAAVLSAGLMELGTFQRIEDPTVDSRFAIRGEHPVPDDIVLIDLDNTSLSRAGGFPVPRGLHADVIDNLNKAGVRAIGYDFQFTEPGPDPKQDLALADSVGRSKAPVILATTEVDAGTGEHPVLGGPKVLDRLGAVAAYSANFPLDAGAVYRRFTFGGYGLHGFTVALREAETGTQVSPAAFPRGGAWIDYAGPAGSFPAVPFWQVADGRFDPAAVRGKTAIVGASAQSLNDLHATSVGRRGSQQMPGDEIHANALATLRAGLPLSGAPPLLDVLLVLAMAFVVPVGSIRLRSPWLALVGVPLAAVTLFLLGVQLAFGAGLIVSVVYPLLALLVAFVGTLAIYYVSSAVERQRTRGLFSRFVPETVVDQVLAEAGSDLRLGGTRQHCTLLFADLRSFTTASELLEPEAVIEIVNRYLSIMTDAILAHGGTLITYMGDGIMALFGAPIPQADHADKSVAAAREMVGPRLDEFNEWMRGKGFGEGFRMGVGINSGPVMVGNVGSERRMDYTAIGDTVNTASRIEGMTKGTPHMIFVSDSTRSMLQHPLTDLFYVDEMQVRGRKRPVQLWSVPDGSDESARGSAEPGT
jgi:adenylate cyclase